MSFGRAKAGCAPFEEDLGGWGVLGREIGWLVQGAGRMGTGDCRAECGYRRLRRTAPQMDRVAGAWMVDTKPSFEQGLRADGAEQRDVHRDSHDPPHTQAAGEGSVTLQNRLLAPVKGKLALRSYTVGLMFWLRRNRLVGSYLFLSATSLSYFSG